MDGRAVTVRDNKRTNIAYSFKGKKDIESHDHLCPVKNGIKKC